MQPGVMGCPKKHCHAEHVSANGQSLPPGNLNQNFFSQENNMNLYIIIGFVAFVVIVAVCAHFWS